MKKTVTLLMVCIVISGCQTLVARYDVNLTEVERPKEAAERYGEYQITKTPEEDKYSFEDQMVTIVWVVGSKQIAFWLENKTEHTIKIIWDEAVFIDENRSSHRVIHSGVKYTDANSPQPPSIIVKRGRIEDIVVPTDNIHFVPGQYGGWRVRPLFAQESGKKEILDKRIEAVVGTEFQVLLPLEIEGVINEYTFSFVIEGGESKWETINYF